MRFYITVQEAIPLWNYVSTSTAFFCRDLEKAFQEVCPNEKMGILFMNAWMFEMGRISGMREVRQKQTRRERRKAGGRKYADFEE